MLLNFCKQTFHISHVRISQSVKGVLVSNFRYIIFMWKRRYWKIFKFALNAFSIFKSAGNYMFKVNNRNTRKRCEICSKLIIKTQELFNYKLWAISIITSLAQIACIAAVSNKKKKFPIKDLFSKCDQIRRKLRAWSYLLKKFFIENFIFVQWIVYFSSFLVNA